MAAAENPIRLTCLDTVLPLAALLAALTVGGVSHGYAYDGADRVIALSRSLNGLVDTDVATRDDAGRLLRLVTADGERRMVYDPAARLAGERRVAGADAWLRMSTYDGQGNRTGTWTGTPQAGSATAFDQTWTTPSGAVPSELVLPGVEWQPAPAGTQVQGAGVLTVDLDLGSDLGPWWSVGVTPATSALLAGQERSAGLRFGPAAVVVVAGADGQQRIEIRGGSPGAWTVLGSSPSHAAVWPVTLVVLAQPEDRLLAQLETSTGQVLARVQATAAGFGLTPGLVAEATGGADTNATFTNLRFDRLEMLETVTSTYTLANQLEQHTVVQAGAIVATTSYTFDAAGDLREQRETPTVGPVAVTSYHWDMRHRLTRQTLPNGTSVTYGYLGTGYRRASLTAQDQTTTFTWLGDQTIAETDPTTAKGYLPGPSGRPLALIGALGSPQPTSLVYAQDLLGDVVGIARLATTNDPDEGTWVYANRFRYDAWGHVDEQVRQVADLGGGVFEASYVAPTQISTGPRYKGQWQDATGELYLRNRYYQPGQGRFLSVDPARAGGNWYAYCGGDPVNRWDPTGLAAYFFDGTRNHPFVTSRNGEINYKTNVRILFEGYRDGNLKAFYVPGIGSGYNADGSETAGWTPSNWDWYQSVSGTSMTARADYMMERLEEQLQAGDKVVDVVGFSRGAATATLFLNKIQTKKDAGNPLYADINVRNVILFDQVPSDMTVAHQVTGRIMDTIGYTGTLTLWSPDTYARNANDAEFLLPAGMTFAHQPLHLVALDEQRKEFAVSDLTRALQIGLRGKHSGIGGGDGGSIFEIIARETAIEYVERNGSRVFQRRYLDASIQSNLRSDAAQAAHAAAMHLYRTKAQQSGPWMQGFLLAPSAYAHAPVDLAEMTKRRFAPLLTASPTDNSARLYNDNEQRHLPASTQLHPSVFWFDSDPLNEVP